MGGWLPECNVCAGSGVYLIMDQSGRERGVIPCPVCFGSGRDAEAEEAQDAEDEQRWQERCDAALAIIRANAATTPARPTVSEPEGAGGNPIAGETE